MQTPQTNTKVDLLFDNIRPLSQYLKDKGTALHNISGIYTFWWINNDTTIIDSLYRAIKLKGKKDTDGHILHDIIWKWNIDKPYICLYAGKATSIKTRMLQHLEYGTNSNDWYERPYTVYHRKSGPEKPDRTIDFLLKRTTACQFRAGLEHLFKKSPDTDLAEKLKHIGFAYIEETDPVERFYLEDLTIGIYRPWFNVDVER